MISEYFEKFLNDKAVSCAPSTIQAYKIYIVIFYRFAETIDLVYINQLNADVLRAYIVYLRSNYNTSVICTYFAIVKIFLRWLYLWHYVPADYTLNIRLPKIDKGIKVPVTAAEVAAIDNYLLNHNNKLRSLRNFCVFHLMLDCGLRRQEVANLRPQDIPGDNTMHIIGSKGNKSRIVLLPSFLQQSILNYYNMSAPTHGYIFTGYQGEHMQITNVDYIVSSVSVKAGIRKLHPHLLRHTFGTSYCYYNGNLNMLRLLMGHSSINTTQIYIHLSVEQHLTGSDIYKLDDIFFRRSFYV